MTQRITPVPVRWIQSLFNTFGSGLLEPETGIVLKNRGTFHAVADPRDEPYASAY